ncbi:MAG: ribbon-helix-helix domain-containing protein [Candidatus Methanoplasma sp.]|nr:ribbon-helix-helix domain-containing protein [Candidatus Methanoplasma sp.]
MSVKIPYGLIDAIEKDIDATSEHRSRSEYIVAAVRYYVEHRKNMISKDREQTGGGAKAE